MKFLLVAFFMVVSVTFFAQTSGKLIGSITDNVTKQPVVGAKITLTEKNNTNPKRALTNNEGIYEIPNIPYGTYSMMVTILSFDTIQMTVRIDKPTVKQDIVLGGSQELEEVKVIGNLVKEGNVPVAVTKISLQKITEELASRDLPMLLNGTAGVYATQTGGGDGDARISVRGFDQRNVGVLIDGVPVNDMENGSVYWSNWFGLDAITAQMQVQRGLGATKIAMPSIGGTINILTSGIGSKKGGSLKQEYGTGNMLRTTFAYNSGMSKKGWGFTVSGLSLIHI
jgi:iron complex outermembrane receptor protein